MQTPKKKLLRIHELIAAILIELNSLEVSIESTQTSLQVVSRDGNVIFLGMDKRPHGRKD